MQNEITFEPFTISTIENFPVRECTIQSTKEENIYYSSYWYECIIANIEHKKDGYVIDYCKPYICTGYDRPYFGWDKTEISDCTGDFWPNIENPVRNEQMVVIAFRKVNDTEVQEVLKKKSEIAEHGIDSQIWDD